LTVDQLVVNWFADNLVASQIFTADSQPVLLLGEQIVLADAQLVQVPHARVEIEVDTWGAAN
jgi:hypothetical protein